MAFGLKSLSNETAILGTVDFKIFTMLILTEDYIVDKGRFTKIWRGLTFYLTHTPALCIIFFVGPVAQLVRVPACHAGGRGFEPLLVRFIFETPLCRGVFAW